jgi:hypothetical protein
MDNSILKYKKELIHWVNNLDDLDVLSELIALKSKEESISLSSEKEVVSDDFDQQFAAGMTSDELLENIAAHLESADPEESFVVSDIQSEYAVKDDFDERFSKGLSTENARQESKKKVREWWGK